MPSSPANIQTADRFGVVTDAPDGATIHASSASPPPLPLLTPFPQEKKRNHNGNGCAVTRRTDASGAATTTSQASPAPAAYWTTPWSASYHVGRENTLGGCTALPLGREVFAPPRDPFRTARVSVSKGGESAVCVFAIWPERVVAFPTQLSHLGLPQSRFPRTLCALSSTPLPSRSPRAPRASANAAAAWTKRSLRERPEDGAANASEEGLRNSFSASSTSASLPGPHMGHSRTSHVAGASVLPPPHPAPLS